MSPLPSAEWCRPGHQRRWQGALHVYPGNTKSQLYFYGPQPDPYARRPESPHEPRLATFVWCWEYNTAADPVVVVPRNSATQSWLLTSWGQPPWLGANGIVAPPTGRIPLYHSQGSIVGCQRPAWCLHDRRRCGCGTDVRICRLSTLGVISRRLILGRVEIFCRVSDLLVHPVTYRRGYIIKCLCAAMFSYAAVRRRTEAWKNRRR